MKEKIKKQKGFIQIPLLIAIIVSITAISVGGYSVFEYYKTSKLVKEADKFTKAEKYEEAIERLTLAQVSWFAKNLGIKKQEISDKQEENKKLIEELSKYNQGLSKLGEGDYQEAINLFSEIPENSLYHKDAQRKIEEAKRKIVEEELGETKIAKKKAESKATQEAIKRTQAEEKAQQESIKRSQAEAKAKQEEFEKNLKEQQLSEKEAEEKRMNADNDGDDLTYRRELELGTSDWNTDSDGDGIIDSEDTHPAGGGGYDAQYFSWKYDYDKTSWEWKYSIPTDWYQYYRNKPRLPHGAIYVTYNDNAIKAIAKQLKDTAVSKNYHEVSFAIFFIQGLPYVEDYFTGYDDRPKYPVETLIDRNGDCEDLSYLAASIITAMGYGAVLVEFPGNPGHMAIAIKAMSEQSGTYYNLDGDRYYYFETTAEGWKLGGIPDEFRNTPATLIKIPSGEIVNNISPQYKKPCKYSSDYSAYFDGSNFYTDSQCNNLTYCLPYKKYYINPQITTKLYWDSGCSQEVTISCYKSKTYPGYFYKSGDAWYYDSRCAQLYQSMSCDYPSIWSYSCTSEYSYSSKKSTCDYYQSSEYLKDLAADCYQELEQCRRDIDEYQQKKNDYDQCWSRKE